MPEYQFKWLYSFKLHILFKMVCKLLSLGRSNENASVEGRHLQTFAGISSERVLTQALNVAATNHRILANNIANVDTPHFSPTELDFQATLRRELEGRSHVDLRTTRARHIDYRSERPEFERLVFLSKNDYNGVDLDDQMAKLSENRSRYTTYAALLTKRYRSYKSMLDSLR